MEHSKKRYVIDPDSTPIKERVYVGEGHRLPDKPSRHQLRYSFIKGVVIYATGERLTCPWDRDQHGRYTTVDARVWYLNEMRRLEGLS